MSIAKRVLARYLRARIQWKGNKAEGQHTKAELRKGRSGWEAVVTTNFGRQEHVDTDSASYKTEAKELAEEMIQRYDREIERSGRENWA